MTVAFYTLGCKVNQYESQAMGEMLKANGYEIISEKENADIYIINSCTVTSQASQKTRQAIRRFKKNHPDSIIVLTGCMPQAYQQDSEDLIEADIVIGNKSNSKLLSLLDEYEKFGKRIVRISQHKTGDSFDVLPITSFDERTRAYVKIQDGCNRFCSYCIIPTSRGRVRSKPIEAIRNEVAALANNGYKEVVLVGINLSSYGQDNGSSFPLAVKTACEIDGIERVRLGSLEPDHLTDEVIFELSQLPKLCPQFHLALQSGCDKTLKAMNRHYDTKEFKDICGKLRQKFDGCTITTDIMVGFAGESEEDFEESVNFAREIGFEKIHVFPYSVRSGTKAEKLSGHIQKSEKEHRAKIMIEEAEKIRRAYFKSLIGKELEVLFETKNADGCYLGHSRNYTPVVVNSDCDICGKIMKAKITAIGDGDFVQGELIPHNH